MAERWHPGSSPIDAATFGATLAAERCLVIHFWAEWDQHDRLLDRALGPIRAEFAGRVAFRSADVDQPELVPICRACGVGNVPALSFFAGGRRTNTLIGVRPAAELRQLLADLVADDDGHRPPTPTPPSAR